MELTDEQLAILEDRLLEEGLSSPELFDELLDHLATEIELSMAKGKPFQQSLEDAFKPYTQGRFVEIENMRIELLNTQTMNSITFFSGLFSGACIAAGSIFKIFHWPFANILITLGIVILIVLFLPTLFSGYVKKESTRIGKISQFSGVIGFILLIGSGLFKFMHWPGATFAMYGGVCFLLMIYLPLMIYKNSFSAFGRSRNQTVIIVLIMSLAGVLFLSLKGSDKTSIALIQSSSKWMQNIVEEQDLTLLPESEKRKALISKLNDLQEELIFINGSQTSLNQKEPVREWLNSGKLRTIYDELSALQSIQMNDYKAFVDYWFENKTVAEAYTAIHLLKIRACVRYASRE
jgi:hypothetical protein